MADRFPDYDVLAKAGTPSWNQQTSHVVMARIALPERDPGLGPDRIATLRRIVDRVVPQPKGRPLVNVVAQLLERIGRDAGSGYRFAEMPTFRAAWTIGLDAIDDEARQARHLPFAHLDDVRADGLLRGVSAGIALSAKWQGMSPADFWQWRLLPDLVAAYWAHPSAWSAMGFGGPASPRGYVRLRANRHDPWEAVERDDEEARTDAA